MVNYNKFIAKPWGKMQNYHEYLLWLTFQICGFGNMPRSHKEFRLPAASTVQKG